MSNKVSQKRKQFRKSHSAYLEDAQQLINYHKRWRNWSKQNKKGFFPIFVPDFLNKMKSISGNAIKLYIYLGAHIDNQAGYTILSVETMAKYFNTSKRTVQNWLKELKEHQLILRIQPAYKQSTQTFLLPYHDIYNDEYSSAQLIINEYFDENFDIEDDIDF